MGDPIELLGVITTNALMTCYSRYVAKLLAPHMPVYLSTFVLPPTSSELDTDDICIVGGPNGASCHGADISFFLPLSARMTKRTKVGYESQLETDRADEYSSAFINFAYGGPGPFEPYSSDVDVSTTF